MASKSAQKRVCPRNIKTTAIKCDTGKGICFHAEGSSAVHLGRARREEYFDFYNQRGPPDSPYSGGEYYGVLLFPPDYPFKPPGIKTFTPSGRFHPDRKICFSMSDFHPGSWNPAWSVATILTGLLSFMLSDEMTTGSLTSTEAHKRGFASRSHNWNVAQPGFREAFPEYCTPTMRNLPNMGERERGKPEIPIQVRPSQPESASISSPAEEITRVPIGPPAPGGWMTGWRHFMYEKWRLCAFIALAVMVSRFSSRG